MLVLLAVGSRWFPSTAPGAPVAVATPIGEVVVIDGDTLRLPGGERLRLADVDTPERGRPFADEASAFVLARISGRALSLVPADGPRDRYGRRLGDLLVEGESLSAQLVSAGLAVVIEPRAEALLERQRQAVRGRVGMHARLDRAAGPFVLTRARFHRPNCPALGDPGGREQVPDAEAALLAGRAPCRECLPWPP